MLEFYRAYATYADLMALTEEMLSRLCILHSGDDTFDGKPLSSKRHLGAYRSMTVWWNTPRFQRQDPRSRYPARSSTTFGDQEG